MAHNKYDIGDLIRLSGSFKDMDNQPIDPTTVICYVRSPSDVLYTYSLDQAEVVKDSVGEYHYDFDTVATQITNTDSGTWHYRFEGGGSAQASEEKSFIIRYSAVIAG